MNLLKEKIIVEPCYMNVLEFSSHAPRECIDVPVVLVPVPRMVAPCALGAWRCKPQAGFVLIQTNSTLREEYIQICVYVIVPNRSSKVLGIWKL